MAHPESPNLTAAQIEQLVSALDLWVSRHPEPDTQAFAFADNSPFSPRELLTSLQEIAEDPHTLAGEYQEVRTDMEFGSSARYFLRMTRFALEVEPFEELINRFEQRGYAV